MSLDREGCLLATQVDNAYFPKADLTRRGWLALLERQVDTTRVRRIVGRQVESTTNRLHARYRRGGVAEEPACRVEDLDPKLCARDACGREPLQLCNHVQRLDSVWRDGAAWLRAGAIGVDSNVTARSECGCGWHEKNRGTTQRKAAASHDAPPFNQNIPIALRTCGGGTGFPGIRLQGSAYA